MFIFVIVRMHACMSGLCIMIDYIFMFMHIYTCNMAMLYILSKDLKVENFD